MLGDQQDAFGNLLAGLGDFVDAIGKALDVLRFERGDKVGAKRLADLGGDGLVLAARSHKVVQGRAGTGVLEELAQRADALAGLFGAGLEQTEQLVFLPEQLLQWHHVVEILTNEVPSSDNNFGPATEWDGQFTPNDFSARRRK